MQITIWLKTMSTVYIGGDPAKGKSPPVTVILDKPQVLVDHEKGIITIMETK